MTEDEPENLDDNYNAAAAAAASCDFGEMPRKMKMKCKKMTVQKQTLMKLMIKIIDPLRTQDQDPGEKLNPDHDEILDLEEEKTP